MKLAYLRFVDGVVEVPGGRQLGEDSFTDACESTFRAVDGWELHETVLGTVTLQMPFMPEAYTITGLPYGKFPAPPEPVSTVAARDGTPLLGFQAVLDEGKKAKKR